LDQSFDAVIAACADIRENNGEGTWITKDMMAAYSRLHAAGHAHSVEVWDDASLVGGLYGVAMGQGFFGESMFSRRPNASKLALAALVRFLSGHGFHFIDCQVTSPHLLQFGAKEVPRKCFLKALDTATRAPGLMGGWDWAQSAAAVVAGEISIKKHNSGIQGLGIPEPLNPESKF
jgi:leucyl/phenylalanyl-tRNA--protein transferase